MPQLQSGRPAEVGMSAAGLERAAGLLAAAVDAGAIGAASLAVCPWRVRRPHHRFK
jgi:hypothetical protein